MNFLVNRSGTTIAKRCYSIALGLLCYQTGR